MVGKWKPVNGLEHELTETDLGETITVSGSYIVGQLPEDGETKGQIKVQLLQEGESPAPGFEEEPSNEPNETENPIQDKAEGDPSTEESNNEGDGTEATGETNTDLDQQTEEEKQPGINDWVAGKAGVYYVFVEEVNYISDYAGYRTALNAYSKVIGEMEQLYQEVFAEIGIQPNNAETVPPVYTAYSTLMGEFLNRDVKGYLTEIVTYTLTANLTHFDTIANQQINVQSTMYELSQKMPVLAQQMAEIRETASTNAEQIEAQLQLLSEWQEQVQNLSALGTENAANQQQNRMDATDIQSQLSQLLQTSGSIRDNSESTVEMAHSVTEIFESFDQDVSVLAASSEELSTDAAGLMSDFQQQIQKNNRFAGGFVELLNNTHNDGVLNEAVMDFIANPVEKDFKGSVEAAETIKPFTWVLLIYGISLFIGYLVATNQLVFIKKDDFEPMKITLKQKGYPILIVFGLSLVLGIVEGVFSGNFLAIPFAARFLWVTLTTMLSIIFALVNYGLIKFMKNVGLGLSIYFLISYVFVSEKMGTMGQTIGFTQVVRDLNPLIWGEKALAAILNTQSGVGFVIGLAVLVVLLGGVLFVFNKKLVEQEVA